MTNPFLRFFRGFGECIREKGGFLIKNEKSIFCHSFLKREKDKSVIQSICMTKSMTNQFSEVLVCFVID
jgi:hypothetical protein